ncbi:MAG: class I SAM-dependent methyltransferase [Gaiellaceae bacterium]
MAFARVHFADDRVSFPAGDATQLDVAGTFDLVACFETVEHAPDADAAVESLRRASADNRTPPLPHLRCLTRSCNAPSRVSPTHMSGCRRRRSRRRGSTWVDC